MATSGKLQLTVIEARVEHDQNMFSSMKPSVQIEHRMERHQTKPASGKEPKFGETFTFNVKYIGDDFDMRLMNDGNLMAEATIKVSGLCVNGGMDDWWVVQKNGKTEGHIHFSSVWIPSEAQTGSKELSAKEAEIAQLQAQNQQMQMNNMQQQQQQQMQPMGYPQPMMYQQPQVIMMGQQQQQAPCRRVKGEHSQKITCGKCRQEIMTDVSQDETANCMFFWIMFICGFFTGITWFLSCLPWCGCGGCGNYVHKCPNCENKCS